MELSYNSQFNFLNGEFDLPQSIVAGFAFQDLKNGRDYVHKELINRFGRIAVLRQLHSDKVVIPSKGPDTAMEIRRGDALLTDQKKLVLTVHTADCLPILFYSDSGIIGAIHSGWRGTVRGITISAVREAVRIYGVRLEKMYFIFMPAIQKCCFEVGLEVAVLFGSRDHNKNENITVDITEENKKQLLSLGVPEQNIRINSDCTFCSTNLDYPSFRKDGVIKRRIINFIVRIA